MMRKRLDWKPVIGLFALILILSCPAAGAKETSEADKQALQELNQKASNPVGELWMITNQFNFNLYQSDKIRLFKDPKLQFNWNFQPVLTFEAGSDMRLVTRPVIPLYTNPYVALPGRVDYTTGLGDMEFMALLAPKKDTGFIFGAGPTAIFPTAADKHLGNGKWQLGPAVAALYTNEKWVVGIFTQQWWSFAGDASRSNVSLTKAQYFLWYSPAPTWQIGMAPNILVDWMQTKAENRWTVPVGLGVAKIVRLGKLPIKFSVEADYSVIRPRNIPGNEWTFKFTMTPILPKLF